MRGCQKGTRRKAIRAVNEQLSGVTSCDTKCVTTAEEKENQNKTQNQNFLIRTNMRTQRLTLNQRPESAGTRDAFRLYLRNIISGDGHAVLPSGGDFNSRHFFRLFKFFRFFW